MRVESCEVDWAHWMMCVLSEVKVLLHLGHCCMPSGWSAVVGMVHVFWLVKCCWLICLER
jgi:hypothetical protein